MDTQVRRLYYLKHLNILILIIQVNININVFTGNCSKDEFLKAISKIGITGFTDKNLLDLFEAYDIDRSGELDYKEFVGSIFSNASLAQEKKPQGTTRGDERSQGKSGSKKAYLQVEG